MALETLKGVEKIGGFEICACKEDMDGDHPISVDHSESEICFRIQYAPIKEVGLMGCQVDTLIHAARHIIQELDKKYPSHYNLEAIRGLTLAIEQLNGRTRDREKRGVEGTSKK